MRSQLSKLAALFACLSSIWLFLGMFETIPFVFQIPGETMLRTHASIAVIFLLLAAWGFWNQD